MKMNSYFPQLAISHLFTNLFDNCSTGASGDSGSTTMASASKQEQAKKNQDLAVVQLSERNRNLSKEKQGLQQQLANYQRLLADMQAIVEEGTHDSQFNV